MKCYLIEILACFAFVLSVRSEALAQDVGMRSDAGAAEQLVKCDTVQQRNRYFFGADIRGAYIFPTNGFFEDYNRKGAPIDKSLSFHLKYAYKFSPDSRMGKLYPFAYQGIGVAYNTFFNQDEIGSPIAVYLFQGAKIARLSNSLTLDYEWNFGASFFWHKYDRQTNPYNIVVGSFVNAYMNVALLLDWQVDRNWKMTAGIDLTHFSNGNTNYPNSGVNHIGARLGVMRDFSFNKSQTPKRNKSSAGVVSGPNIITYDLVLYGAVRKKGLIIGDVSYIVPGVFAIAGFNFYPMYNFNKYFRAGISFDAQYDESANIKEHLADRSEYGELQFYRPAFKEQCSIGLSLRFELVMSIFSINFGLGKNLVNISEDIGGYYQILALKTLITKNIFLHIGYQLRNFQEPNNLMIGLGYRFNNR